MNISTTAWNFIDWRSSAFFYWNFHYVSINNAKCFGFVCQSRQESFKDFSQPRMCIQMKIIKSFWLCMLKKVFLSIS